MLFSTKILNTHDCTQVPKYSNTFFFVLYMFFFIYFFIQQGIVLGIQIIHVIQAYSTEIHNSFSSNCIPINKRSIYMQLLDLQLCI